MSKLIGYCHGAAGEEIARQASVLFHFAGTKNAELILYREVRRPGKAPGRTFNQALTDAKQASCSVALATLGDLSKQPPFLVQLQNAGVSFSVLDDPTATPATLPLLLRIAEEHKARSAQIRHALAGKARTLKSLDEAQREALAGLGEKTKLGGRPIDDSGRLTSARVRRSAAETRVEIIGDEVRALWADGVTTNTEIAKRLNEKGLPRPRGGEWTGTYVSRITAKLKKR